MLSCVDAPKQTAEQVLVVEPEATFKKGSKGQADRCS